MSSLSDFLEDRGRPIKRAGKAPRGRLGLLDLLVVAGICFAVVGRTPVGSLAWYVGQRVQGTDVPLPSLTATFSHGMMAAPAVDLVAPPEETLREDQLPEPWRTALRTALTESFPEPLGQRLVAAGEEATVDGAMNAVDGLYEGNPAQALEQLVLGDELWQRAVARAHAAGAESPDDYEGHRVYLPNRVRVDSDRIVGGTLAVARVLDLGWPVADHFRVTSGFGYRTHPVLKTRKFHNGTDVGVPIGTPVTAPQAGKIEVAGENSTSGKFIVIDHGQGVQTSYCHLSAYEAARGAQVEAGDIIAKSGNTGRSTGPHLHYIVRIGGDAVDPMRFRPEPTAP